jgi:MATE family multidrug resistance protein
VLMTLRFDRMSRRLVTRGALEPGKSGQTPRQSA